jgi:glycerol uptake facilitator-like aquaporin
VLEPVSLGRRAACEGVGTAILLAAVIGSGIMAQRLSGGNTAIALLANTLATGGALFAIIATFGPYSGAHFNPVVTLADAWRGGMPWGAVPAYLAAQIAGGLAGTAIANTMFGDPVFFASERVRAGPAQALGEAVATFGLLVTIWGCSRRAPQLVAYAVSGYIVGAYWFTSSTSFANPAVTIARSLSDTFAGIRPVDVPAFITAQLVGGATATVFFHWVDPVQRKQIDPITVPHERIPERSHAG